MHDFELEHEHDDLTEATLLDEGESPLLPDDLEPAFDRVLVLRRWTFP